MNRMLLLLNMTGMPIRWFPKAKLHGGRFWFWEFRWLRIEIQVYSKSLGARMIFELDAATKYLEKGSLVESKEGVM